MSKHKEIAWLGFELKVPADWEVARHSLSPQTGTLMLVDRRRHRMDLSWRQCNKEPDVQRSCQDLQNRLREKNPGVRCQPLTRARGWTGFWYEGAAGEIITRALRWEKQSTQLVDILLVSRPEDETPHPDLVQRILKDFRSTAKPGNATHWEVFGIDCHTPPGWRLVSTNVKPMDVTLRFEHYRSDGKKPDGRTMAINRLGMAESWFNGDTKAFLQKKEPKLTFDFEETEVQGHEATLARTRTKGKLFQALVGQTRDRQELIWVCEPANSLFRVTAVSPPKLSLKPRDFVVNCLPKAE